MTIKIFYAHSSHRQSILDVYEKICEKYKNDEHIKY
jgi:hypothetical protein